MEGMIGEVRIFAGNFAPRAWAICQGQLLSISSNTALFSILGTIYGGDGRTTFALPDLRGRTAIGPGTGPGLPSYREGQRVGAPTTALTVLNLPQHSHMIPGQTVSGTISIGRNGEGNEGSGNNLANPNINTEDAEGQIVGTASLNIPAQNTGLTGSQQSFNNMQPSLAIYYIICTQGIFPSRN